MCSSDLRGQSLTKFQIPAIILLLVGVTLVSVNFSDLKKGIVSLLTGVKEALLSATIFGVFYWPLNEYVAEEANWLTVSFIVKLTAILFVGALAIFSKKSLSIKNSNKKFAYLLAAVGILEAIAILSVTFGQSFGDGIIVAPISSALTIVTVALAMLFGKEKITRVQGLGIALAVSGIIITAF
mgnify:CR=1 FL=1